MHLDCLKFKLSIRMCSVQLEFLLLRAVFFHDDEALMSHVNSSSVAPACLWCCNIWICIFIQPHLTAHVKKFAVIKWSTSVCICEIWSWATCVHLVKPAQWNPRPQEVACCRSWQTRPMCFPLQCFSLSLCQSVFAADWEKWWEVRAGVMNVWAFSVRLKHSHRIYH